MTRADVAAMLRSAQMTHINQHVTGMLLQVGDRFLHYLEGPKAQVQAMLRSLQGDARFAETVTLLEGPIQRRLYPHWSLAFQELNLPSTRLGALNGLLERALSEAPSELAQLDPSGAQLHRFWTQCATGLPR